MSIDPSNTFFNSDQEFLFQQFASSDNPAESYNPAEEVAFAMLFNSSCSSPSPNPTPFNLFDSAPPSKPLSPLQLFHSSSLFGAQENGAASSSLLELPSAPESSNPFDEMQEDQEDGAPSSSLLELPSAPESSNPFDEMQEDQENGAASSSLLELPSASESYNSSDAMQEDGAASSSLLDPKSRQCANCSNCGATTTKRRDPYNANLRLCDNCYYMTPKPGKCANPECGAEEAPAWRTNPNNPTTFLCTNCWSKTPKPGKCAIPNCTTDSSTKWLTDPRNPKNKTAKVCRPHWRALRKQMGQTY